MILGHEDIQHYILSEKLDITNITELTIRENGMDCRIGDEISLDVKVGSEWNEFIVDTHNKESIDKRFRTLPIINNTIIPAKNNVLLYTMEKFKLPDDIMGFCCLRSTIARLGFVSPITIIDAGFEGTLTIEAWYGGNNSIMIYCGDRFLHVVFAKISSPVLKPYSGVYSGQTKVRLPKIMD